MNLRIKLFERENDKTASIITFFIIQNYGGFTYFFNLNVKIIRSYIISGVSHFLNNAFPLCVISTIPDNKTSTNSRLVQCSCAVMYKQLFMYTNSGESCSVWPTPSLLSSPLQQLLFENHTSFIYICHSNPQLLDI